MPKTRTTAFASAQRRRCIPAYSLGSGSHHGRLAPGVIAGVVGIPSRTLARRKTAEKLSWEESERLLRLALVFEKEVQMFEGDAAAAVRWLTSPNRALQDHAPLGYSRTEIGAKEVEGLVGRADRQAKASPSCTILVATKDPILARYGAPVIWG